MRFLLISASGKVSPSPVEIETIDQLLAYLDFEDGCNDLILSPRSLASMAHDRIQRNTGCSHVLCLYDDFIEPKMETKPRKRKSNGP